VADKIPFIEDNPPLHCPWPLSGREFELDNSTWPGLPHSYRYACIEFRGESPPFRLLQNKLTNVLSEHCIEGLRQHVMCQPDLTVWTLDWIPGSPDPVSNHVVDHECVDWNHLEDWVDQRSFSLHENLIRRPDGKSTYATIVESPLTFQGTVWPWEDPME
jgi:hypothetical protein